MTSTEIVRSTDVPADIDKQIRMAQAYAPSDLLPRHLREKPANVLVILSGARALDVPAFWALQSMHVIEGKLSMAADLMRALVIRAGHKVRVTEDRVKKSATVTIFRKDDPGFEASSTFTWEDAKTAELLGKTNWKKYPMAMLIARATSAAVRTHCPEVLFGVIYTPEELGAETDAEGNVIEGEVAEEVSPADIQPQIDELFEKLSTMSLVEAGKTFWNTQQALTDDIRPSNMPHKTLRDWWYDRLLMEIRDAYTKDELTEIWKAAKGTGVLEDVPRTEEETTFKDRIFKELGDIDEGKKKRPEKNAETEEEAIQMLRDGGIESVVIETTSRVINTDTSEQLRQEARESWSSPE